MLVDEGHRGTSKEGGAWMSRREVLVRGGFAFEYSATFGQAVAKGLTVVKAEQELTREKPECCLKQPTCEDLMNLKSSN